jgi:hypothetical protein
MVLRIKNLWRVEIKQFHAQMVRCDQNEFGSSAKESSILFPVPPSSKEDGHHRGDGAHLEVVRLARFTGRAGDP